MTNGHRFRRSGGIDEFAAIGWQLKSERETAAHVVGPLLRQTPRERWPDLATHAGRVQSRRGAPRPRALVAPRSYPSVLLAQIRADAWKDLGAALRTVARYREALEAFDCADAELGDLITVTHNRAVVLFERIITLQEMGQLQESLRLLPRSVPYRLRALTSATAPVPFDVASVGGSLFESN